MIYNPWDYQRAACEWILSHPKCGLFLEMGLGKTVVTLTAIKTLLDDFDVSRVLVVAPLRVAATVWAEEAKKWDHLQELRIVKVLGSAEERNAALEQDADIYVINRENLRWLTHREHELHSSHWYFDMIVLDELSSFKNPKAERFKAIKSAAPRTRRIVGLTGTPAPNSLLDLWSQIFILDGGERLGKFVTNFRTKYFYPGRVNGPVVYDWVLKPGADKKIYEKIGDICMSMTAKDYLQLPKRRDISYPVALNSGAEKAYKTMERDLVLPVADEAITAQNAAVLTGKLLQLSNGAIYTQDDAYITIHDAKLDALEDLIEAANGSPVLVYYIFKHDAARIQQRFPDAVILDGPEEVNAWNAGKIPLLIAHPASAGHGLNLQKGGHIIVWFGLTWSLELYMQANARLYRQGQSQPVMVYHIIARGTMDEEVMKVLARKENRQDALIDAVKARVRCYAG